jgi:polyisoprenoid-binding protein YceI
VTGTVEVDGDTVEAADLETDMTTLRSDESRRDNALRDRGIETDRFPTARFELTGPFELSQRPVPARGRLTLHGETKPVVARVSGRRSGDAIELAGSAPVDFAAFGIEPPSLPGFVTVRDAGRLEFSLRLAPR